MSYPDLSIRPDFIQRPMNKVREWLEANTSSLQVLQAAQILQRVRAALGGQISSLNDEDIHVAIRSWAQEHGFRGVYPAGSPISKAQEFEIVTRVKNVISAIPTNVTVESKDAAIKITASGPTATLKHGSTRISVSGDWSGALQFKTEAPGVVFGAAISQQSWSLTFGLGRLTPDLTNMDKVFKSGEGAVRGALGDLKRVDWSSASNTRQIFAPYLDPVKAAVSAASRTASLKPGELNLGAWVGGDISGGVTGGIRLVIVF
jgi:hypothetical protein